MNYQNTIAISTIVVASYLLYLRKTAPPPKKTLSIFKRRKPTRHKVLRGDEEGINIKWLDNLFPILKKHFLPQAEVKYKGVNWKISCYMELEDSFISGSYQVQPAIELLSACRPLLDQCDELFGNWWRHCYGLKRARPYRVHSFLTRYLPLKDQDQLKKHIDGKHLDGSVVVRLPSKCVGGQLKGKDTTNKHTSLFFLDCILLEITHCYSLFFFFNIVNCSFVYICLLLIIN